MPAVVRYGSFFVLGVGTLFAWNAFITAATYFSSRFCGSEHEKTFENDVGRFGSLRCQQKEHFSAFRVVA